MNAWQAYAKQIGTQFASIVRRIDRAEAYFIKAKGRPILHGSEIEAELAAHRHIVHLLNTEPRFIPATKRSGTIALEEKTFGTVTSRKGTKTQVRRMRRRRAAAKDGAIA